MCAHGSILTVGFHSGRSSRPSAEPHFLGLTAPAFALVARCADPDGDGNYKNLVLCSHCESVVHKDRIIRWHNVLPDTKRATYTCPVCTTDIYGVDHADDCDQCNEEPAIYDDFQ